MRFIARSAALLFAAFALSPTLVRGSFHDWRIKEIFTNSDGTVQFIEFFTTSGGQQFVGGHTLTASSDGAAPVSFTLSGNLNVPPGQSTTSKHFLVATAAFATKPGSVAPNYPTLPIKFFEPAATSVVFNFSNGADTATVAGSLIPKDGVNSITDSVLLLFGDTDNYSASANTPTNFAGASGSVNVPPSPAADFTGNGVVNEFDLAAWRIGFGTSAGATKAQGDSDNDQDADGRDFLKWQEQTTSMGAFAAVPEPTTGALAALTLAAAAPVARRLRHA